MVAIAGFEILPCSNCGCDTIDIRNGVFMEQIGRYYRTCIRCGFGEYVTQWKPTSAKGIATIRFLRIGPNFAGSEGGVITVQGGPPKGG